ncbi:UvrD-helicase domain-containing protein [Tahibacter soli]|uniref:DNA 3'-5' helicase II n=1 Tax=Tahibacter soli TaxID=2983605 RepID=A0A9X3YHL5_9GAMM|nr:UvrD-helicase domain-containing protein [Tahibacter soli]MDC8010973.1 UvrD-helicase domain-containing protein [Tahibacter soli]
MNQPAPLNPAKAEAEKAMAQLFECIRTGQSFVFEAGAGAGKTYSLIEALERLLAERGRSLVRQHQQIACITFTNVAKNEIDTRTDRHPAVYSDTIHGFCWSLLKDQQGELRRLIPELKKWPERLAEAGEIGTRQINYELGFPRVEDDVLSLSHDDVLDLMTACLSKPKFRRMMTARYPILFIDEYQDTDADFVNALMTHFLGQPGAPLIGLFGDGWQKIYGDGCGTVSYEGLASIGKGANFRSVPAVVSVLNKMRPELPQAVEDEDAPGSAVVYHTNGWTGARRTEAHWKGDVSPDAAKAYMDRVKALLTEDGWRFESGETKVLMLTHNLLAQEQGYAGIAAVFAGRTDAFVKKEDAHIAFLVDVVEPACAAFAAKRYGEMVAILGGAMPRITSPQRKAAIRASMERLVALRTAGTIGEVIDYLRAEDGFHLPEKVEGKETGLLLDAAKNADGTALPETGTAEENEGGEQQAAAWMERLRQLRQVPYAEVVVLERFINGMTPFATKHGVKGAQFNNVLVVVGRGWNQYNFDQMLAWVSKGVPKGKAETFERSRNLFYVACSRPRKRLAVLFTQEVSPPAMETLKSWFGAGSVHEMTDVG